MVTADNLKAGAVLGTRPGSEGIQGSTLPLPVICPAGCLCPTQRSMLQRAVCCRPLKEVVRSGNASNSLPSGERKMSESTEYRLRVAIFVATITFVLHFFFNIG
jgi:hypothetical protein